MAKKKNTKLNFLLLGLASLVLAFALIIFLQKSNTIQYISKNLKNSLNDPKRKDIYLIDVSVTPTIFPSPRKGWLTFVNPTDNYRFEYPSTWKVNVSKNIHIKDNIYDVSLSYFYDDKEYPVNFMIGGRGGPNYDYEKITYKILGGKTTKWVTMYRQNLPFEAVVTFPNKEFDKYFIGLYVYLPPSNQKEFVKNLEEIIASFRLIK